MSGRAAKTADGVEVREGNVVWCDLHGGHLTRIREFWPDKDVVSVTCEHASSGRYVGHLYSSRLAALVAARARAAGEVERLDREIEKEKGNAG